VASSHGAIRISTSFFLTGRPAIDPAKRRRADQKRRRVVPPVSSTTARVKFSRSISSARCGCALHLGRPVVLARGLRRRADTAQRHRAVAVVRGRRDNGRNLSAELFRPLKDSRFRDRERRQSDRTDRAAALFVLPGPGSANQHGERMVHRLRKRARGNPAGLGQFSGSTRSRKSAEPAARSTPSRSRAIRTVTAHAERKCAAGDLEVIRCIARADRRLADRRFELAIVLSDNAIMLNSEATARGVKAAQGSALVFQEQNSWSTDSTARSRQQARSAARHPARTLGLGLSPGE